MRARMQARMQARMWARLICRFVGHAVNPPPSRLEDEASSKRRLHRGRERSIDGVVGVGKPISAAIALESVGAGHVIKVSSRPHAINHQDDACEVAPTHRTPGGRCAERVHVAAEVVVRVHRATDPEVQTEA